MKKVFFVTASIGCGKSSFIQIAKNKGFKTLNADEIAHKILDKEAMKIATFFNDSILVTNAKIDRKALGKLVFNDKAAKEKLENFIHPKIYAEILQEIQNLSANEVCFIELPLFFESKNYKNLGQSILIYAPKELSLQRIMKRDNISEEEALKKINSQMDIEEKKVLADFVIENFGSYEDFQKKCELFLQNFSKEIR